MIADRDTSPPSPTGVRLLDIAIEPEVEPGTWTLSIRTVRPVTEGEASEWGSLILEAFRGLANVGGFGPSRAGATAPCFPDPPEFTVSEERWLQWHLGRSDVPPAAYTVLVNLLEYGSLAICEVDDVVLAAGAHDTLVDDRVRGYPARRRDVPFPLTVSGDGMAGLDIHVEFPRAPSRDEQRGAVRALGAWLRAVLAGGFVSPTQHPGLLESRLDDPPVSVVDNVLVLRFDELAATPAMFDALANMCSWIHANVVPITGVHAD
ncbi:MAG: hypothetical protein MUE41_01405 [Gemmatimonadaceae bacterium]|jgi:hypothetical protein|nr:hypothetical protein [Gemmatimonadaceae bacterium]